MIERILKAPVNAVRTAWSFVNPSRTAGRIPLGRVVIVTQIVATLVFVGYTLSKKSIQLPFSDEPYRVQLLFPDAQGLDRLDQPAAAVAGTTVGKVEKVTLDQGRALVTLNLDPEVKGKIFADASAAIRPASALQNLLVNVDPGTPSAGKLADDAVIQPVHTKGYVTIDQLTSILDADTQSYLTILIQQARLAVGGREDELRRSLSQLGRLASNATPISRTLAERRRLLTSLVGELNVVFRTLAQRGEQLSGAIENGNRTLAVTAGRDGEVAQLVEELGPTLEEARRSIAGVRAIAVPLLPALDKLAPGAGPLAKSLAKLRAQLPRGNRLLDRFDELVKRGKRPLRLLLGGTRGLSGRTEQLVPELQDATTLVRSLDKYKEGAAQTADVLSAAFSRQDNNGTYAPIDIVKAEGAKPENFGFASDSRAARRNGKAHSKLERDLAKALELSCLTQNPLACLYRFNATGLPKMPVLRNVSPKKGGGR